MEVGLKFLRVRHEINQRGLEQVWFNRTDAVAFHRREASIFLERSAEVEEGFPLRLAEVADVDAGQDDFPGPGLRGLRASTRVVAMSAERRPRARGMVQKAQKRHIRPAP